MCPGFEVAYFRPCQFGLSTQEEQLWLCHWTSVWSDAGTSSRVVSSFGALCPSFSVHFSQHVFVAHSLSRHSGPWIGVFDGALSLVLVLSRLGSGGDDISVLSRLALRGAVLSRLSVLLGLSRLGSGGIFFGVSALSRLALWGAVLPRLSLLLVLLRLGSCGEFSALSRLAPRGAVLSRLGSGGDVSALSRLVPGWALINIPTGLPVNETPNLHGHRYHAGGRDGDVCGHCHSLEICT